ncbi:Putative Sporulation protein RMD1 [Rhizopus microsporus]|nr:Putative Sporulation protein RMD1 [Rhizopus microsporus]
MNRLSEYLQSKRKTNGTTPKRFDECLYTQFAFTYPPKPPQATETVEQDTTILIPEMFLFDYGVIVFWGMELKEEQRILKLLEPFEEEKLDPDDVETEELYFYYDNHCRKFWRGVSIKK